MADLILSGGIVDLILALALVEALGLVVYRRLTGRGVPVGALVWNLLAGAGLLLALREALAGAAWQTIAACLGAALAAHLADLRQRWHAPRWGVSGRPRALSRTGR